MKMFFIVIRFVSFKKYNVSMLWVNGQSVEKKNAV